MMQSYRNVISYLLLLGLLPCRGAEKIDGKVPETMPLRQIEAGIFEIGKVRLNKKERTVSIPASINMREGTVEYFLVTGAGKTHESVLRTEAEPYHIHLAMLLLGAKGKGTNTFPENKSVPPPGDPIKIEIHSNGDGKRSLLRAEDSIIDRAAKSPMQGVDWIYNGSQIGEEGFAAQQTGSIISLIDDPDALINSPLPQRDNDENWEVNTNAFSEATTEIKVVITLPAVSNRNKRDQSRER